MRPQQVYDETCCSSRVKPAPAGSIERSDVVNPASRVSAPALSDARARVAGRPKWTRPGARLVNGRACDGGVGIGDAAFRNPACLRRSGAISLSGNSCDLFQGKGTVVID